MDHSRINLLIRELRESSRNLQAAIEALERLEISRGNTPFKGVGVRPKSRTTKGVQVSDRDSSLVGATLKEKAAGAS